MPPKGKKPAKKAKEKKVEEILDKSFYESQIADLNAVLSALRSKQLVVEVRNEELLNKKQTLEEGKKDIMQYLNRTIQERNDHYRTLQDEFIRVENERGLALQEFEDARQKYMDSYRETEENLQSDIKLFVGKVNALEEFRLHRDELMKKYEIMEDALEEQIVRHKQEIYDVERKFIIGKDKLKKEMDSKLKWLIEEFQAVTDLRIAATTHRVIGENIALNNKLEEMLQTLRELLNNHEKYTSDDDRYKLMAELCQTQSRMVSKTLHKTLAKLINMVNEYFVMEKHISKSESIEDTVKELVKIQTTRNELANEVRRDKRIMGQHLHELRCQRIELVGEINYLRENNLSLIDILQNIKETIISLNDVPNIYDVYDNSPENDEEHISKSTILYRLYDYVKQIIDWQNQPPVIDKLDDRNDIYRLGRLGLMPRKVVLKSMMPIMASKGEQTENSSYFHYSEFDENQIEEEEEEEEEEELDDISVAMVEQETQTELETEEITSSELSTSVSEESTEFQT